MTLPKNQKMGKKTVKNVPSQEKTLTRYQKIAKSRGQSWKNSISQGRMESDANPSRLRKIRMEKLKTQKEVASDLHLTKPTYAMIERSMRPVTLGRAQSIAAYFGVKVEFVFSKREDGKFIAVQ